MKIIHITRHTGGSVKLQVEGTSRKSLLEMLESRLKEDFTYESGRIIGSMCTRPHSLGKEVFTKFVDKNIGDSGLFPAVVDIEKETIKMLGSFLSNARAQGHIVTGGTEANILALWTARKLSKSDKGEVVVPKSAHYSFDKAADLLGLKLVKVRLNEKFQVDVEAVKDAINPHTIAIVGMAGTTALGVVDPLLDMSEIALKENLYLHVDAAFGGFVLPFMKRLNFKVPDFDFALPGVCSMTIDPHKMGLAPIPSGGILFRDGELEKKVALDIPYLSGGETEQTTLVGTRSGASVIAVWSLLKYLGTEGYKKIVKRCMRLTWKLAEEIQRIEGLGIVIPPTMNIVGLKSEIFDIRRIAQELRLRKWAVSLFPNHIRIVSMPHVQEQHIESFLEDLNAIAYKLGR
jgi:tyrosine decarboxylase/aspartate 1-decarboxylase